MSRFWNWLRQFFETLRAYAADEEPRDVIYGEEALAAREEIIDIRLRCNRLLMKRLYLKRGTPEYDANLEEYKRTVAEFSALDEKYFGARS